MAGTRILYFDAERLIVYRATEQTISEIGTYHPDTAGITAFTKILEQGKRDTYYLMADLVEESFHADRIPYVKGRSREELVQRRIQKAYPYTEYRLPLSIGFEKINRLDEKLLFIGLTNKKILEVWLKVLGENNIRLAGLYSFSLMVPILLNTIGQEASWTITASFSPGGMRLTLCENNALRFSRLILPPSFDPIDLAEFCATETTKTIQYLLTVRILPKNFPQIIVLVIVPEIDMALFERALTPTLSLYPRFISIETCAVLTGLRHYPITGLSDALFCHLLAKYPPETQFAPPSILKHYRLTRLKQWLFIATAVIVAGCLSITIHQATESFDLYQSLRFLKQENTDKTQQLQQRSRNWFGQVLEPETFEKVATTYQHILDRNRFDITNVLAKIDQLNDSEPVLHFSRIAWTIQLSPALNPDVPWHSSLAYPIAFSIEGWVNFNELNVPSTQRFANSLSRVQKFVEDLREEFRAEVDIRQLPLNLSPEQTLELDNQTFEQTHYDFAIDFKLPFPNQLNKDQP